MHGIQVARVGFSPLKGGRHLTHRSVWLTEDGPAGDRVFCLVDPVTDRCLRTSDHPRLLQSRAAWDGRVLAVGLPSGTVVGEPVPTGDVRWVDYWGRDVPVELVAGPWAAAFSDHLGRAVALATCAPGDVVYGGPVTVVTRGSLDRLAEHVGTPVDGARFRATFELSSGAPDDESGWVGRRLRIGAAELRVSGAVVRCGVIDLDPESGVRDLGLLKALGDRPGGGIGFGVEAEVTRPGRVTTGDPVLLGGK